MVSLNVANRNNLMTETDGCFSFFFLLSLVFEVTGCEDGKDADKGACLASSASAEMLFDESELETVMKGTRKKDVCVRRSQNVFRFYTGSSYAVFRRIALPVLFFPAQTSHISIGHS